MRCLAIVLMLSTYKKPSDNLRRQISSVIQGHDDGNTKIKKSENMQGSDLSDFETSDKVIVTPGKHKNCTVTNT